MTMLSIFMTQGYEEYIDKIYNFLILLDFWCKACIITLEKYHYLMYGVLHDEVITYQECISGCIEGCRNHACAGGTCHAVRFGNALLHIQRFL